MTFPNDIQNAEWPDQSNYQMWSEPKVTNLQGVVLRPLEAKALHVIGTSAQILDSVGYLLYCGSDTGPCATYYLHAYLLACTAIELLGRCKSGESSISKHTLKEGLESVGLETVT